MDDIQFDSELDKFKAATRGLFKPFMCCTRDAQNAPALPGIVCAPAGSPPSAAGRQPFEEKAA